MPNINLLAAQHAAHGRDRAAFLLMFLLLAILVLPAGTAEADTVRAQEVPASYEMIAENDAFQLYVDSSTLAFKLLDKRSNYLWHSGIDEPIEGDRLNTSWRAFAQSGISI
ncbi:MAG: hypothetical protein IPK19_08915 [Chloroflexi bacterium]|nr:hypothetical protein [Chloroflexota bacterium]